jgi:glycosyltransferase involved in cell wall biosynthesis
MVKKIAWLTPYGPRSDVGAHSAAVVEAIHRRAPEYDCEISLFIQKNGTNYRSEAQQFTLDEGFDPRILNLFDVNVFNIGNNQENHSFINRLALTKSGIVVVHDIVMQHYIAWTIFEKLRFPKHYVDLMVRHYGRDALDVLESSRITLKNEHTRYAPWDTQHALSFPLIEPFLEKATAVVVHSQFAADIVARITDARQLRLFLPSDKKKSAPPPPKVLEKLIYTVMGHVGAAKHIHLCLEAFQTSDLLRQKGHLVVIGGGNDKDYVNFLKQTVRDDGLSAHVTFYLNASEDRLLQVKSETDVYVNVRYPNTESASGSLAEQMACGAPVIVYNSGCYVELPDDSVYKIYDVGSARPLIAAMERLLLEPNLRQSIGTSALAYSEVRTADAYATEFLKFVAAEDHQNSIAPVVSRPASTKFDWLSQAVGNLLHEVPEEPWFAKARNAAHLGSMQSLSLHDVPRYLAAAVFQQTIPNERLVQVDVLLSQLENRLKIQHLARVRFFISALHQNAVIPAIQLDLKHDALALAIIKTLSPQAYIEVCYRAIIGRPPFEGEVVRYAERLDRERAGDIMREFLGSEEAIRRGRPAYFTHGLSELARQIDEIEPVEMRGWFAARSGTTITAFDLFTAGAMSGWHDLEYEGIWSSARKAIIRFSLEDMPKHGHVLQLKVHAAATASNDMRQIAVNVNGEEVVQKLVEANKPTLLDVPVLLDSDTQSITLAIVVDRTVCPADSAIRGDTRSFGIFLHNLRFLQLEHHA